MQDTEGRQLKMMNRLMNIVTIIQARTGSTRLPGKILMEAAGKPLLLHMLERVDRSTLKGTIVVATSNDPEDDIIEELCKASGYNLFRGSTNDLLDRHYRASITYSADIVLKIPSDCPLIDPQIIDRVITYFLTNRSKLDYVSNLHPQSYPDGNDVEVFSFNALYKAHTAAGKDYEREHTTPFIWNHPEKFRTGNVLWETMLDLSKTHRFVLDYYEDYIFIKSVYEQLYHINPAFNLYDIVNLLKLRPEIAAINSHYLGNSWYKKYENELRFIKNQEVEFIQL